MFESSGKNYENYFSNSSYKLQFINLHFCQSRHWAKNRPTSTEDDTDDHNTNSSSAKCRKRSVKAELYEKLEIINQLHEEKEADKKQINELETKLRNLQLDMTSRIQFFDMKQEWNRNETLDELKRCQ